MPINELLLSRKFSWVYLASLLFNISICIYYQVNIWGMMPLLILLGIMTIYSFFEIEKIQKEP
ncbi:MAG TPA: hypothetical protein DEB42_03540 [Jeotgalicoccus sp.]|nr:hypothetical protein [Jeotgalicoccus sp.]